MTHSMQGFKCRKKERLARVKDDQSIFKKQGNTCDASLLAKLAAVLWGCLDNLLSTAEAAMNTGMDKGRWLELCADAFWSWEITNDHNFNAISILDGKIQKPVFSGWYLVSGAMLSPVRRLGFGFGSGMGGRNVVTSGYRIASDSPGVGKCPFLGICFTSPSIICWRSIPNSSLMFFIGTFTTPCSLMIFQSLQGDSKASLTGAPSWRRSSFEDSTQVDQEKRNSAGMSNMLTYTYIHVVV